MRRLLVVLLLACPVLALVTACGGSMYDPPDTDRANDVAFVTELMHRDAALLNLLDVALGRRLDPSVASATEQLRHDAIARIEASAHQLETWGEKVPKTVRDHGFEHSSDGGDIPSLAGMPTGDDLHELGEVPPARFEEAFVALLRDSVEATRDLAGNHTPDAESVQRLARDAERSCDKALDAL
ncbi:MAG: hypothetical protein ACJ72P_08040 [Nocardioides sp.]